MNLLLRFAVATLPLSMRDRYREQWLADVRDAPAFGIGRAGIVAGALVFAISLSRNDSTTLEPTERARRRVRIGLALTASGYIFAFGAYLAGISTIFGFQLGSIVQVIALSVSTALIAVGIVGGFGFLAIGSFGSHARSIVAITATAGMGAGYATAVASPFVLGGSLAFELCAIAAVVIVVSILTLSVWVFHGTIPQQLPPSSDRAKRRTLWIGGSAITGTVIVGALDALVWMPQAMAPDYSLTQIYAALGLNTAYAVIPMAFWILGWGVAAPIVLWRMSRLPSVTVRGLATLALLAVSATIFFQWWASFGMGATIADVLPPYAGGHSGLSPAYWFVGQLTLSFVIVRTVVPPVNSRQGEPASYPS